ncbi:MAG: DUF983 domain-containing protein [Gemmatimonadota bacterium]|nr:DUF983 domain-containing protein [Gemmatimonadota bacterium]
MSENLPSRRDPEQLSVRRALRLYGRALLLRCPHCGGGRLLESWFRLRPVCPTCGLRTDRGEEDFFLGAMMFNLVLAEGLLALSLVGLLVATWPRVPWTFLQYGLVALIAAAPFFFFPYARTIWLASDILIRPVTEEEMRWYREHPPTALRHFRDR